VWERFQEKLWNPKSVGSGILGKLEEGGMLEDVCGVDREEEKHRDCVTDCDSRFYPNARLFCFLCTDKPTGYGSSSRRAPQTGIVDECCFRSCDLRRLEMYCAPLKPAKSARSVRAQRHTDVPKTQKVSQPGGIQPSSSHLCLLHVSEPKQKF
jgi:hypothetical protein